MISLKRLFLFIFIIEIIFMGLIIFLMQSNIIIDRRLKAAVENQFALEKAADELRQTSDDLTRFSRMYVVTGNPEYKEIFFRIQDIRNGRAPRPQHYHDIFWDYMEPERSERHPDGVAQSLMDVFRLLSLEDAEMSKLDEAYKSSEGLIELEREAFLAVDGLLGDVEETDAFELYSNQAYAMDLLFSESYLEEKQNIMRPIDEFMEMIESRTESEILQLDRWNLASQAGFFFTTVIFFIINLIIFRILHSRIVRVISGIIFSIRSSKKNRTVLNIPAPEARGLDELGELITEFNNMSSIITKRSKLLEKSNSRLVDQYNMIDNYIPISVSTAEGIITQVSNAFCRVSGYSRDELIGGLHHMTICGDDSCSDPLDLFSEITRGNSWQGEIRSINKDGEYYWLDVHVDPEYDRDNKVTGYIMIGSDITARMQLRKLSVTDPLTEVFNRNKINEILPDLVYSAERYSQPLSLIMIDIDNFKDVNDTYGHQAGDVVLKGFSGIFKNNIRRSDTAGRWGGEEFMITCPDTNIDDAVKLSEKLRRLCEEMVFTDMRPQTASFGVAEYRRQDRIDDLISRADTALYRAKEEGRNRVSSI